MQATAKKSIAGALAAALALSPVPAASAPPDAATLGTDVLRNVILGDLRSQLSGALDEMGCKGPALAGVSGAASPGRPPGAVPAAAGSASAIPTPGRLPRPAGLPSTAGNIMPKAAGSAGSIPPARGARPAHASPGTAGGIDPAMLTLMMAMMDSHSGGSGPGSVDQATGMKGAMAAIEQAMAKPLSRAETVGMFGELADLGIITPAMAGEARDCIVQAPPAAVEAAGIAGSILKNVLIPRLAIAKTRLSNLSREERDALVEAMIEELRNAPTADRSVFFDGYGRGFYPTAIVERVRSRL